MPPEIPEKAQINTSPDNPSDSSISGDNTIINSTGKPGEDNKFPFNDVQNPIWLTVSEAAKIGGVQGKTIRRALTAKTLKYKIVGNRYFIDLASLINYLNTNTKLKNKLNQYGVGQYVDNWNL